jgi:hypothetical protein
VLGIEETAILAAARDILKTVRGRNSGVAAIARAIAPSE